VSSLRHRVLVHLADYGVVEDPAGRVTRMVAAALDTTSSRVGTVLARLDDDGLVTRQHSKISGRTFRAALTDQGRAAVNRQGHNHHATRRRVEAPAVAPRMPVCGPMTTVPFDPEHARERALGGVA
jgi:DNA-binding MarR family transcriptional regulator